MLEWVHIICWITVFDVQDKIIHYLNNRVIKRGFRKGSLDNVTLNSTLNGFLPIRLVLKY